MRILNGTVVDGLGGEGFRADVTVEGDRIASVDPRPDGAPRAVPEDGDVDASGCLVTPGFIDSHSHSDAYLLIEPGAPSKISQGVTTEINGQCGGSAVPRLGEARLSSDWASMDYPAPGGGTAHGPTWRTMREYRELFAQVRPSVNSVQFIGHNTLRSSVMGYAPRRASPDCLKAMEKLLSRELDDGGWGLTTGLIYQPGKYSDEAEVTALAGVAARKGRLYATHMRSEGDAILEAVDEVLRLVRATGIRAEISHLKTSGKRNWGKIDRLLDTIQKAVDGGLLLGSDRYPYCAAGTDLDVVFPDWAGEGGTTAECARLADAGVSARIAEELDASGRDWSEVTIGGTWAEETRRFCGRTVAEILASDDAPAATPGGAVTAILRADACRTGAFFSGMSEDNMHRILERPWVVPGSDASLRAPWGPLGRDHPHPRAYGTMPRFFKMLTEGPSPACTPGEAVARMTSIPARRFGLRGRGEISRGAFADIAVWRRAGFEDCATYKRPHAFSRGVEAVIVNGILSYRGGKILGPGAGRVLDP